MNKRLAAFFSQVADAVRDNPAEVFLAITYTVLACLRYFDIIGFQDSFLGYFPVSFLLTYILNTLTAGKRLLRSLYYLSVFLGLFFLLVEVDMWKTVVYPVSLIVIQLLYLASCRYRDNRRFAAEALRYLQALLSALLLSLVAYALTISIYMAISSIFEVFLHQDRMIQVNAANIMFIGLMPLLFLLFIRSDKENEFLIDNGLFDILLNYVLTPALLIYVAILYLYFIKIVVLWSLPKGVVAYIVVCFVTGAFVLKGCQPFVRKRRYDWFYDRVAWIVLPALAMYWVGTFYRINEYGYTEPRVYLVVTGFILTAMAFLFISKRWGRYLYVTYIAVASLCAVTYIPGIDARSIERRSQSGRVNLDKEALDSKLSYIEINNEMPFSITGYDMAVNLKNWKYNRSDSDYKQDCYYFEKAGDTLRIMGEDGRTLLFEEDVNQLMSRQARKANVSLHDTIPVSSYAALLRLDIDSCSTVIFDNIYLKRVSPDSAYKVSGIEPFIYLKKNNNGSK